MVSNPSPDRIQWNLHQIVNNNNNKTYPYLSELRPNQVLGIQKRTYTWVSQRQHKSNNLAHSEFTGLVTDDMQLAWKRNNRQTLHLALLEYLTTSLLLSSLHSQDMAFVNSSASILATFQSLQCHLLHNYLCNRRITLRALVATAAVRRLLLYSSLPCSSLDFYSNVQMTVNTLYVVRGCHACLSLLWICL